MSLYDQVLSLLKKVLISLKHFFFISFAHFRIKSFNCKNCMSTL